MELHTENQPHPWHYLALGLLFILIVFFGAAVYLTGQSFTPQDWADARTIDALQQETLAHTQAMNDLTEQNTADALTHTTQRRQYMTWFLFGLAASLTSLVALLVLTSGAAITTWSFRVSVQNLALAAQTWRELRTQPLPVILPNGYTALPPTMADHHLLDTRTGQGNRLAEGTPASDHRTHLEQTDTAAHALEHLATERANRSLLAAIWQRLTTPLPHRPSPPMVLSQTAQNQNQKTKK